MDKSLTRLARWSLGLGVVGSIMSTCLYNVDGGERAVIFNRMGGVSLKTVGEGTHFRLPWFQTAYVMDVKTRPKVLATTSGSKDLQTVSLTLRVLSRPDVENLPVIFKTLGQNYDDTVWTSIGNESLKSVIAGYDAGELITQRDRVSADITENLRTRAANFHIILDDVSLTHVTFGQEFSQAIEAKQVAQQEAERARFVVSKNEQEKEAAIIRAEGEAEAAKLISQALQKQGSGLIELRRIEATKEIANTLSKSKNVTYLPSGGDGNGGSVGGGGSGGILLGLNTNN